MLRTTGERYRELARSITDVFMAVDRGFRVTYWNRALERLTGTFAENAVGRSVYDLMPGFQGKAAEAAMLVAMRSGEPQSVEYALDSGGGKRLLEMRAYPSREGVSIFASDVTEKRMAEAAFQQANKKLNLLSSVTRHDILNQLTILSGYAELLKLTVENDKAKEQLLKAEGAIRAIQRQIEFTRVYQNLGVESPQWQQVSRVLERARGQLNLRSIRVMDETGGKEIFADPLLEKVFYNLIDNALRYGFKLSRIRLYFEDGGERPVLVVEDVGIQEKEKELIFERGYGHNTGLGLFLCREILSITGTDIKESGRYGDGARFEITIPQEHVRAAGA